LGYIYEIKYPLENNEGELTVATTRPETIFGDTALAVHSKDPRYLQFHGKFVIHPATKERIPIIIDDLLVDPAFGTGVVKVTPAHDFNDNLTGKRHELPSKNILNDDGTLNEYCGQWQGLDRLEARASLLKYLDTNGYLLGKKPNAMRVARCSRSSDILEPLLKPQWYVKTKSMADRALQSVENKDITIHPSYYKDDWFRWLGNIQDWCISRQLWWGHRVPAYKVITTQKKTVEEEKWVVAKSLDEAKKRAVDLYGLAGDQFTLEQVS
jgi:valyl-tRNA synthetase